MSPGDAANDQEPLMIGPDSPDADAARREVDLMAYLDGELEASKLAEVEAKLKSDPAYAARLKALAMVGTIVRDDAERVYEAARIDDGLTDAIMQKVESTPRERVSYPQNVVPLSDIAPPTSRGARMKKNAVIWVAFGSVAAAAAGLLLYVRAQEAKQQKVATPATVTQETVAAVKTPNPPPSDKNPPTPPAPIEESSKAVEVEDLEVGEGATVIYTRGKEGQGQNVVVWINEKH